MYIYNHGAIIMLEQTNIKKTRTSESGMSLIAVAMLTVVLGGFISSGAILYSQWDRASSSYETNNNLQSVQVALQNYFARNGRYPCPAPLTAPIDGVSADGVPFGTEVTNDCEDPVSDGTFKSTGIDGDGVRTGAVPVRTLNIPDKYAFDKYNHRLVYAVTEAYAVDGTTITRNEGDITIVDDENRNATSQAGNIVQTVFSMGRDTNGTYGVSGNEIAPCDLSTTAGEYDLESSENCDFTVNATFKNTLNKSENDADLFVAKVTYPPSKTIITCGANGGTASPRNAGFIVDTSGSMGSQGFCPMGGNCRRIHDAQWAMRRVVLSRMQSNTQQSDPGTTSITGFVAYDTTASVAGEFDNSSIVFDDPTVNNYVAPTEADALANLEDTLDGMCPSGWTPLGIHIRAVADNIGPGTPGRPNKVIVLSDGVNTAGDLTPLEAAFYIQDRYNIMREPPLPDGSPGPPILDANGLQIREIKIVVDIVDVVGNEAEMRPVAEATGGRYYSTNDPDRLLEDLRFSAGVCSDYEPTIPSDTNHC